MANLRSVGYQKNKGGLSSLQCGNRAEQMQASSRESQKNTNNRKVRRYNNESGFTMPTFQRTTKENQIKQAWAIRRQDKVMNPLSEEISKKGLLKKQQKAVAIEKVRRWT